MVGALLLAACSTGPDHVDMRAFRRRLAPLADRAYPVLAGTEVRCPASVEVRRGRSFECSIGPSTARLTVGVRQGARGVLALTPRQAVVTKEAAEQFVAAHLSIPGTVDCGAAPVHVLAPGAVLACTVAFTDGATQAVRLRVADTAGTLTIEPTADGATPSPPPPSPGGTVSWAPIGRSVLGRPSVFQAQSGPVGLAWMNPSLLHPVLVAGTGDPAGSPGPWGGQVAPESRPLLAAAFNSGFKMSDIKGGWVGWGATWRPPVDGDASLVIYNDGRATVGEWGRDVSMTPDVAFVRQNLPLLVDGGSPVPSTANPGAWGASISGAATWRSAVGVDANGALVFASGGSIPPSALADALVAAGVQRAMELDINPQWVSFHTYAVDVDGAVNGTRVYGTSARPDGRYLQPDERDFFALLVRGLVEPGATGPAGLAPLQATVRAKTE